MEKPTPTMNSALLSEVVVKGIQEKKGHSITCLNLTGITNAVTDYFIICHGDSNTQVGAIAQSIISEVEKVTGEKPWHKEGYENAEWILLDYSNVVVHVFQRAIREFYNLEDLWADAEITEIADL